MFQIAYDAIADQFFRDEDDARKWAKEERGMDLSQGKAKVKALYFESYHVRLVSGELLQIRDCAKWAVHEALKTGGEKTPNSSIEED